MLEELSNKKNQQIFEIQSFSCVPDLSGSPADSRMLTQDEGFFICERKMKKEIVPLKVDSFRGESVIFYPMKGKADNEILKQFFNNKEIEEIEKDFDKFYKLVFDNGIDEQAQALLGKFKQELKSTYFLYLWQLIEFGPRSAVNAGNETIKVDLLNDAKSRENLLFHAKQKLFFLADIVIAFVMGNEEKLRKITDRVKIMTGRKLTKAKKKVLEKIIEERKALKREKNSSHEFSWKVAIQNVYRKLSSQEKKDLLDLNSKEKLNLALPPKIPDKKIKAISEDIRYHQNKGNLPK